LNLKEVKKDVIYTTIGDRLAIPKANFEWLINQAEKVETNDIIAAFDIDWMRREAERLEKQSLDILKKHNGEKLGSNRGCPDCGKDCQSWILDCIGCKTIGKRGSFNQ
jgi:hypothetical protein